MALILEARANRDDTLVETVRELQGWYDTWTLQPIPGDSKFKPSGSAPPP
ncbi:MAG: hypothetical protein HC889_00755 [Synechococcaceae cyanobacterium SM1_2_3]|nr:hypothetical protein [Synechococcaceae cyanobacterium SM1_2_3]